MKSTELRNRGELFFKAKFEGQKGKQFLGTSLTHENILVSYIDTRNDHQEKLKFKILPEEFFSENGIELFKERLKNEKEAYIQAQMRMNKLGR